MIFKSPGEILININGFPVYYYGVIMELACLIGVYISYKLFKKYHPDENYRRIWDFAAYLLISGIIGARLYYCCLNPSRYFENPLEIFNIREGGLSIHGALLVGIIMLIVLAKRYKLDSMKLLDVFSCGTAFAQSLGRGGNFFNSEAFGTPTNLPWKLYIPPSQRPDEYINYDFFHPTFLYESILDLLIFIVLLFILKKYSTKSPGTTMFSYLIMYAAARIFVESFRTDSVLNFMGIHIAHIISLIMLLVGIIGIILNVKLYKVKG